MLRFGDGCLGLITRSRALNVTASSTGAVLTDARLPSAEDAAPSETAEEQDSEGDAAEEDPAEMQDAVVENQTEQGLDQEGGTAGQVGNEGSPIKVRDVYVCVYLYVHAHGWLCHGCPCMASSGCGPVVTACVGHPNVHAAEYHGCMLRHSASVDLHLCR